MFLYAGIFRLFSEHSNSHASCMSCFIHWVCFLCPWSHFAFIDTPTFTPQPSVKTFCSQVFTLEMRVSTGGWKPTYNKLISFFIFCPSFDHTLPPSLLRSWTLRSTSRPWMRSKLVTKTSRGWKTASRSSMTCLSISPCWLRIRYTQQQQRQHTAEINIYDKISDWTYQDNSLTIIKQGIINRAALTLQHLCCSHVGFPFTIKRGLCCLFRCWKLACCCCCCCF